MKPIVCYYSTASMRAWQLGNSIAANHATVRRMWYSIGMEEGRKYTTYILRCGDGTLYTGYAADVQARLAKHNAGMGAKYTRSRLPAALVYEERYATRSEAQKREAEIKRLTREEKLKLIARAEEDPPAT